MNSQDSVHTCLRYFIFGNSSNTPQKEGSFIIWKSVIFQEIRSLFLGFGFHVPATILYPLLTVNDQVYLKMEIFYKYPQNECAMENSYSFL